MRRVDGKLINLPEGFLQHRSSSLIPAADTEVRQTRPGILASPTQREQPCTYPGPAKFANDRPALKRLSPNEPSWSRRNAPSRATLAAWGERTTPERDTQHCLTAGLIAALCKQFRRRAYSMYVCRRRKFHACRARLHCTSWQTLNGCG
jgi:hypothetical protein